MDTQPQQPPPVLPGEPLGAGFAEPRNRDGAFPRLDDARCDRLLAVGRRRPVTPGDVLFREGDRNYDFFVVESATVAIVRGFGRENRVLAVHGPGRFLGELNLLTGATVSLTAVVRDAGTVIQVSAEALRRLLDGDDDLSSLITRAYLARRSILIGVGGGPQIIGSCFSPDVRRLREFLARNRVPYEWVDLDTDPEAAGLLRAAGVAAAETPAVIAGETVLRNPSNAGLARSLGLGSPGTTSTRCDLSSSGADRPASPPPCTGHRRGSTRRLSMPLPSGGRPAPHPGSGT
ncbi:MAG TPA: cyclic nucleotide-binding domain-containing protein, partial [Solirubrobacteraceae bacterium]